MKKRRRTEEAFPFSVCGRWLPSPVFATNYFYRPVPAPLPRNICGQPRHPGRLTPRMTPRMTPPWHRLARLHLRRCSGTAVRSPRLAYQAAVLANDLQEDVHHHVKGVVATARDGQATA